MRSKIYRMLDVLYWLELMDWDTYWEIEDVACNAEVAYYKRLNKDRNEK